MNRDLERYLKQATRGLHGSVKKEVWNELEGDILERVSVSRAFGLSESEAVKRALEQLGSAREVSSGMAKTYRLPLVQKTLIGLSTAALVVLLFPSSAQQILTISYWGTWLEVSHLDLTKELKNQGLNLKTGQKNGKDTMSLLTLPNGKQVWINPVNSLRATPSEAQQSLPIKPILQRIHHAGYPIRISGWEKLNITSSLFKLTLEPIQNQNSFAKWYRLSAASWATNNLSDQYMAETIERPVKLEGIRPDLAGKVVVAVTVSKSLSSFSLGYFDGDKNKEVSCNKQQPRAGAFADAVKVGLDGRFALQTIGGKVQQKVLPTVPRTLKDACTPRDIATGVFFAVFDENTAVMSQGFSPLKTQLKVGQTLEPGKTYTL